MADFDLRELEAELGWEYHDPSLLENALSHSSYANEHHTRSNERLEFLGDSVLSLVVARYLYHRFPLRPEGELTRMRAALVCEKALAGFAEAFGLGQYLLLGHGESNTGGRSRPSILSDAFEAVLASLYLDGGFQVAEQFVLRFVTQALAHKDEEIRDYKTALQEIIQKNAEEKIRYVLVGEDGPDHDKHFTVQVHLNSNVIGTGIARSKKEAEQQAARQALELMGEL